MKATKTIVKEFIKNNGLDFSGTGSDLNGHCTTLAGFICHIVKVWEEGISIIENLKLPPNAEIELTRVFTYAYDNNYAEFWDAPKAKELYIF